MRPAARSARIASDERAHERRVHAGAGLVEQDDARVAHQHARQLEKLLLAAGERLRPRAGQRPEIDGLEDRVRALHEGAAPSAVTRAGDAKTRVSPSPGCACA